MCKNIYGKNSCSSQKVNILINNKNSLPLSLRSILANDFFKERKMIEDHEQATQDRIHTQRQLIDWKCANAWSIRKMETEATMILSSLLPS